MLDNLPEDLHVYARTKSFDNDSVPAGLQKSHSTKSATWGKIVVEKGRLRYRILEPVIEEVTLSVERPGYIEPEVLHEVELLGDVQFYVEFYRRG